MLRPRVINGWSDFKNHYPYVVSLEAEHSALAEGNLGFRICSGSLITNEWVLTAAHCNHESLGVARYGNLIIPRNETKEMVRVLKTITHPSYAASMSGLINVDNDIALALVEKIPINILGRIHTADYKTFVGRSCYYAGFGMTSTSSDNDENKPLQVGKGAVRPAGEEAKMSNPGLVVVPECGDTKTYSYSGDSGGPLIIGKRIVGVLSTGFLMPLNNPKLIHCCYTAVSPYIGWIKNYIDAH
ncbi:kallikrein-13-like [Amyelois transitella]|uniref:kallikrein-13-like n=1 Tax=Amyelois transitella TaxID=680683 RepID=UPI0029905B79|nr:kallikrein-13-like [Amyelois transitella]